MLAPVPPQPILPEWVKAPNGILNALTTMMGNPALCSRRWVWRAIRSHGDGRHGRRPGGDAGVVRIHGTQKGLAVTCDVTPRHVRRRSRRWAPGARRRSRPGATSPPSAPIPIAITDNMNLRQSGAAGDHGQFAASIKRMGEARRALDYPVVSGNVSLYNETNGVGIPPTPAIGAVGLIPDAIAHGRHQSEARGRAWSPSASRRGWPRPIAYQQIICEKPRRRAPPVDLADETARPAASSARSFARRASRPCTTFSDGGSARGGGRDGDGVGRAGQRHRRRAVPLRGRAAGACDLVRRGPGRYVVAVDPSGAEEVVERRGCSRCRRASSAARPAPASRFAARPRCRSPSLRRCMRSGCRSIEG